MPRLKKKDREIIQKITDKKEKVRAKVYSILRDICEGNPEIFKKAPESRTKTLERIVKKMAARKDCNIGNLEKRIEDIAGARVTCCTIDEMPAAEELIKKHPDIKKCVVRKQWKDGSDEFGYRGHHLVVTVRIFHENKAINGTCEIQIRTLAMDLWAVLSHRDFYTVPPPPPPPLVQKDMITLSKVLEVVDDLAVTLKKRTRDEIDKEALEKTKGQAQKDMLTPENIQKLVKATFKKKISLDEAYKLLQYALTFDVVSLKHYKRLIAEKSKYRELIRKRYSEQGVEPEFWDHLYYPILLESAGTRIGTNVLKGRIQEIKRRMRAVEKGVAISEETLAKEKKTSQPPRNEKK